MSATFKAEYGTDTGPQCETCNGTLWGYMPRGMYCDDGMPSLEFEARCESCHKSETFEIRGDCAHDVAAVKERHAWKVSYRRSMRGKVGAA